MEQYYVDEASPIEAPTEKLQEVSALVKRIREEQEVVESLETRLKVAKQSLAKLVEDTLVGLMDEIGLAEITTTDGAQVSVKKTLYASVPKKNLRAVAEWLIAHGQGALVQEAVSVAFGKGEQGKVNEVVSLLAQNGVTGVQVAESINTGSLKALIKEMQEQGVDVPLSLMGAFWKREAVIK